MKRGLQDLQDECRTKKRKVLTNVHKAVEPSEELLRSSDAPADVIPLLGILNTTSGSATEFFAEQEKCRERIAELESAKTIAVCRHVKLMEEVKQRHAEEVSVWKETCQENAASRINDVKVAKADTVKMSLERNLIQARFEEHVWALQMLVNANVESIVKLTAALAKIRKLLKSGRSIDPSD